MCMCRTRYPILLIHGTGFRDRKHLCYWGRIPGALENHGAVIAYGNQDSWGTIEDNASVIRDSLIACIRESGCGKVNIIAHSKGGLEARYLASALDCASMIASITTISTPHHGSRLMDFVVGLPPWLLRAAAVFVNFWFRLTGDKNPDFFHVCQQFSAKYMEEFNQICPDAEGVYYQSYATAMKNPLSDIFLFFPNLLVGLTDGKNDGLVSVASAAWTNFKGVWESAALRGISHADAVDLRRRRFTKKKEKAGVTDICDCYVSLVRQLKVDGY